MAYPILYSFRRCPYAMRARLALAASRTEVELREVRLANKPESMLIASPKGTVPVLILPNDSVIDESINIMRWALSQNDPENWLTRDDTALIALNDGPFKQDLDRYKYPQRHGSDAKAHQAAGLSFLRKLEDRLSHQAYLCGSQRSLTDAAIMPFVRQFSAVDADWFATQHLPHLKKWLANFMNSDEFTAVMLRLPPWSLIDSPTIVDWTNNGQFPSQ